MKRIIYIDNLRGFLILLVILGHCLQYTGSGNENLLYRVIYAFHMPLFMAISGYVCYRPKLEWGKIGKRARQLLIPFLSWAFVTCILVGKAEYILEIIPYPDRGLWFLYALFFITFLNTFCDWIARKINMSLEVLTLIVALLLSAIVLLFSIRIFELQYISYYFVFYCAGFFARKYQIPDVLEKKISILLIIIFAVLTLGSGMSVIPKLLSLQDDVFAANVLNDLYQYGVGLLSIPVGLYIFKNTVGGGIKDF